MEDKTTSRAGDQKRESRMESSQEADNEETLVISKFRCVAAQCLAAFATNIVKFCFGACFGFTPIITAALYSNEAGIEMTTNELSWFGSFCFMTPVSAVGAGLLAQSLGNRTVLLLASVIDIVVWILFYYASSSAMLLGGQALVGLTYYVAFGPGTTYVAEISQQHLRSTLMSTSNLCILLGSLFSVTLGSMIHWRKIPLVNFVFPIISFVAVCFIPESPQWLASKGRFGEAERSLMWLRGWVTPKEVSHEFESLKNAYEKSTCTDDNLPTENEKVVDNKCISADSLKPFLERSFYRPVASVCFMLFAHALTGSLALMTYTVIIFDMINSPIDKHIATVIYDALRILGAIFVICVIHRTGKRKLLFMSLISAGSMYTITAIVLFLRNQNYLTAEVFLWIPAILMLAVTFLTSGGIDKVVYMFNVELVPSKYRNLGAGAGLLVSSIFVALINKVFLNMIDAMTLEGVYLFFACTNLLNFISLYFLLPETSGRTLEEIQDHYAGIKSLKSRSSKETVA